MTTGAMKNSVPLKGNSNVNKLKGSSTTARNNNNNNNLNNS